jgi:hypothetical protein
VWKIIWFSVAGALAVFWIAYWIWNRVLDQREEKQRKLGNKQPSRVKKSFEDYAKKMEKYEKPTYKRDD